MSRLTAKQQKFVDGLVAGLSQRKAYIQAGYSTKDKANSYIDTRASELLRNSKVLARYQELMNEHKNKALWTRERAIEELLWGIEQSKNDMDSGYRPATFSAMINAVKELNELEGLYPDKKQSIELSGGVETNKPNAFDDLTPDELRQLINK